MYLVLEIVDSTFLSQGQKLTFQWYTIKQLHKLISNCCDIRGYKVHTHNERWPEQSETLKYLPNSLKMTAHLLFNYNFTVGVQNTYKRSYS